MKELNDIDYKELTNLTDKLEEDIKNKNSDWYNNRKDYMIEINNNLNLIFYFSFKIRSIFLVLLL